MNRETPEELESELSAKSTTALLELYDSLAEDNRKYSPFDETPSVAATRKVLGTIARIVNRRTGVPHLE